METIRLKITGTRPLLMHNGAAMMPDEGADTKGAVVKKIPTPEEEAQRGAYRFPDGTLYLPAEAFRSSMIEAAKGRKFGKRSAPDVVAGSVFVTSDTVALIDDRGTPMTRYEIDVRRAVIRSTGGSVVRARPRLDKWAAVLELEFDPDFVRPDHIVQLAEIAGRIIGVGDYRGGKRRGPFGRFAVELMTDAPAKKGKRAA